MVSLKEILNTSNIVLLDTSACSYRRKGNLNESLRSCYQYAQIEEGLIKEESDRIDGLMSIILSESTRIIPEVIKEIEGYRNYLIKRNEVFLINGVRNEDKETKRQMEHLIEKSNLMIDASLKKELIIEDPKYNILTKMIVLLNKTINIKGAHTASNEEKIVDKYTITDERLVAASYYLSINKKIPSIITGDIHFIDLFDATIPLMGSDEFLPYNNKFRWVTWNKFVRLYFLNNNEEYNITNIKLKERIFPKNFKLHNYPEKSEETKKKMLDLWKQFSEY